MTMWGIQATLPVTAAFYFYGSRKPRVFGAASRKENTIHIKSPAFSISIENSHRLAPDTRVQDHCIAVSLRDG